MTHIRVGSNAFDVSMCPLCGRIRTRTGARVERVGGEWLGALKNNEVWWHTPDGTPTECTKYTRKQFHIALFCTDCPPDPTPTECEGELAQKKADAHRNGYRCRVCGGKVFVPTGAGLRCHTCGEEHERMQVLRSSVFVR